MAAIYYWYAWFLALIIFFFIPSSHLRSRLLLFIWIIMCTYTLADLQLMGSLPFSIFLLGIFGTYFWKIRRKNMIQHFWPIVLSVGYTAVQLFLLVQPVWSRLPGVYLAVIFFLFILHKIFRDLPSLIGVWLLINAFGTLWSYLVLSIYILEEPMFNQQTIIFVLKGMVALFIMYGVYRLKLSLQQKKIKPLRKGGAYV
ncbi:YphA family membrane protein [Halobacillus sp. K22]|uniref:YphA family membrane protein n=1 Tax=Halobacillus sp. K22 TaxID=3457431 RepID=UPI003FCD9277